MAGVGCAFEEKAKEHEQECVLAKRSYLKIQGGEAELKGKAHREMMDPNI